MTKIKQIYYGDWSDKLAPEHEDYWWKVSQIAQLLAGQLEFSTHGCRINPYFYSTISVRDHKEKFGEIRIACSFADPELVKEKYEDYINVINRSNLDYKAYERGEEVPNWKRRMYEENPQDYPKKIMTLEEFTEQGYYKDACYYRQVYLDMVKLFPEYEDVICNAADWYEYLFTDPGELDKCFQDQLDYYKDKQNDNDKKRIKQINKDWDLAKKVCFPIK